jgi:hypothetical protein
MNHNRRKNNILEIKIKVNVNLKKINKKCEGIFQTRIDKGQMDLKKSKNKYIFHSEHMNRKTKQKIKKKQRKPNWNVI